MKATQTPMMAQWHDCKKSAPEALLLFRLGDFYEAFYDDAVVLAQTLDLTLTKRGDVPMAGVPHHSAGGYIDRLIAKGHRVAIAEQIDDPKGGKGIVERKVVRILTPATVIQSGLIEDKEPRYLAALFPLSGRVGIAALEITTATFLATEVEDHKMAQEELLRIRPKEILIEKRWREKGGLIWEINKTIHAAVRGVQSYLFDHKVALDTLLRHFGVETLDGFGLKGMVAAINAAGALLCYVKGELNLPTAHITTIGPIELSSSMSLDHSTRKNLELIHPLHEGQKEATMLFLLDQTKTPMGGRLIRKWLLHPLLCPDAIYARQEEVARHMGDFSTLLELRKNLGQVRDLERLMMRIETGYGTPRDLVSLKFSLLGSARIGPKYALEELVQTIHQALVDTPPARLSEGGAFQLGYDRRLDELWNIKRESKEWIARYQAQLREESGIKTLKIGYNRAHGYYIEVSKGRSGSVPNTFRRRQTLVSSERFLTDHLREFEYKILSADQQIAAIEAELFQGLCKEVARYAKEVGQIAKEIAQIDCTSSLAKLALEREYVRPLVDESNTFAIKKGRHPIIETLEGVDFIANDLSFDHQLALITGPNMAGKSTFIRQAALIAIMAQMGSFVPAEQAQIGVIDQILTRIGASDDLSRGQSTFMVEMAETANILQRATDRSLLILDEIGRGTSTYDGISIAWAVAEYLLTTPGKRAKTLFATHYFEMTQLAEIYCEAFNLTVAVDETADGIAFLRTIAPGVANKSYGIHVAKLAGLPRSALEKAAKKLKQLEGPKRAKPPKNAGQLELFPPPDSPILKELESLDPHTLTPIQALQRLIDWKAHGLGS